MKTTSFPTTLRRKEEKKRPNGGGRRYPSPTEWGVPNNRCTYGEEEWEGPGKGWLKKKAWERWKNGGIRGTRKKTEKEGSKSRTKGELNGGGEGGKKGRFR